MVWNLCHLGMLRYFFVVTLLCETTSIVVYYAIKWGLCSWIYSLTKMNCPVLSSAGSSVDMPPVLGSFGPLTIRLPRGGGASSAARWAPPPADELNKIVPLPQTNTSKLNWETIFRYWSYLGLFFFFYLGLAKVRRISNTADITLHISLFIGLFVRPTNRTSKDLARYSVIVNYDLKNELSKA